MGRKTKDGPETLTIVYYSPVFENIMLLYKRDYNTIHYTIDLQSTRLNETPEQAEYIIINGEYQLIGAFYEN